MAYGAQDIQKEPKTGGQRDGREQPNCEFMTAQTDQFSITDK